MEFWNIVQHQHSHWKLQKGNNNKARSGWQIVFPVVEITAWANHTMKTSKRKWFHPYHLIAWLTERIFVSPHFSPREYLEHTLIIDQQSGAMAYYLSLLSLACTGSTACSPWFHLSLSRLQPNIHCRVCATANLTDFHSDFRMGGMHKTTAWATRCINSLRGCWIRKKWPSCQAFKGIQTKLDWTFMNTQQNKAPPQKEKDKFPVLSQHTTTLLYPQFSCKHRGTVD